ncbi:hypothetical protein BU17DRAFT_96853 [Hysterangium stoloniferum]|nr:hypothetical protein BU17DRAFT_96853 [Hysterangium stoloniferum]
MTSEYDVAPLLPHLLSVQQIALKKCLEFQYGSEVNESLTDAIISSLELQNAFYNRSQSREPSIPSADDDICIFLYSNPEEEVETPTSTDIDEGVQPPTGVFPSLTKCYSPICDELNPCYSSSCPHNTRSTIGRVSPPMGRRSSRCYSSNCEHGQGCYSPTCPNRYLNSLDDRMIEFPASPSSASSSVPRSPFPPPSPLPVYEPIIVISIIGPYITWIDQKCRPLGSKSRRPISSHSPGADASDFWTGGSAEIGVR